MSTAKADNRTGRISFQGFLGAYSHLACSCMFPNMDVMARETFEAAIDLVKNGEADLGMIPIDNSSAGRVADIHHLLPESGLYVVGEHFEPVIHHLLANKGATKDSVKDIYCHRHTVGQIRNIVDRQGYNVHVHADNAGAAQWVSEQTGNTSIAAIASGLAGEMYGLETLDDDINDKLGNTTRFVVLSRDEVVPTFDADKKYVTSLMVETHSVPAALYKVLGGFATNGINITKLESYIVDASFRVARFYMEVEAHREEVRFQHALRELGYFSEFKMLGTYQAASFRG